MAMSRYSPQEAAVVSGISLATIQKAITTRRIPARTNPRTKRRQIDEIALLAFALAEALPPELHLSPETAYRLLHRKPDIHNRIRDELTIGGIVRIDTGKALAEARRRLKLYERARELIASDPNVMGGSPVIRGTRITAHSILGRLGGGDSISSIVKDYPYIDRESVEAAALYAKGKSAARPASRKFAPPRLLIDENLSPLLAHHLRAVHGFDAVHVNEIGLRGSSDVVVQARAITNDRVAMTSNTQMIFASLAGEPESIRAWRLSWKVRVGRGNWYWALARPMRLTASWPEAGRLQVVCSRSIATV